MTMTVAEARAGPPAPSSDAAPAEGVSVVMVSYRTGPVLFAAIAAVLAPDQPGVIELVLVDNGNPPAVTAELARRARSEPRLKVAGGHGNVGFARGCNIGARLATGRTLLFLNPDCCLGAGAVCALLAATEALGEHWMLGCRLVNPDGSEQRGSRRALLTPLTALVESFRLDALAPGLLRSHRLNRHEATLSGDALSGDRISGGLVRVPAISGACMLLPKATFHAVGGMDEGYFLHVDDLDLCYRLHQAGIAIYYAPHVEAKHFLSSSRVSPFFVEWQKARGFLRYFRKHFRGPRWLVLRVPLSLAILARFALKGMRVLLLSLRQRLVPRPRP